MEAFVEKGNLFLLYSGLLKEKQRQIYEYHILEDMSFTEIGLEMGITRQAAQAVFRKADEKLKVIDIPESVTSIGSIGDFSFSYCPVETVVLHSRTIPKFSSVEVSFRRTLKNVYVPDESLELYKKSDWADDAFKAKIKPMSQRH